MNRYFCVISLISFIALAGAVGILHLQNSDLTIHHEVVRTFFAGAAFVSAIQFYLTERFDCSGIADEFVVRSFLMRVRRIRSSTVALFIGCALFLLASEFCAGNTQKIFGVVFCDAVT